MQKYVACLLQVMYANYNEVVPNMKCIVCQYDFKKDDDIVIFECNPKHYFHKLCGLEWLDLKTECPLCRMDFTDDIMKYVMTNDEKLIKKLSEQEPDP